MNVGAIPKSCVIVAPHHHPIARRMACMGHELGSRTHPPARVGVGRAFANAHYGLYNVEARASRRRVLTAYGVRGLCVALNVPQRPSQVQNKPPRPTVSLSSARTTAEHHGGSRVQNKPVRPQFALPRRGQPQNATAGTMYRTNSTGTQCSPGSTRTATEHGGSQVQNKPARLH
jgi:hypothetical protein